MNTYRIPFLYSASHYIIGYLGYSYPQFLILFIIYQLYQYCIDVRFYLLPYNSYNSLSYQKGNSLQHTMKKLCEAFVGLIIAFLIRRIVPSKIV